MTRHFWVLVHRYAGLLMALFLIVIGLTGSIIAFNSELDHWLNPPIKITPRESERLDEMTLRERAQALVPQGMINVLMFNRKPDEAYTASIEARIDPASGKPFELPVTTLTLDPYTGAEIAREKIDDSIWPITRQNVLTLINMLHYQLALPGSIGTYLFGIVALVWTLDCFVSAYLTFPVSVCRREDSVGWARSCAHADSEQRGQTKNLSAHPTQSGRSFFARWKPAWLVKWNGSAYRINFDLHRAGGLWVWLMLLVLAWSSVGFNLSDEVYTPVMKTVFSMPDPYGDLPKLKSPQPEPTLNWREAQSIGQKLMAEQAGLNHFRILREDCLNYMADKGVFFYVVQSDRDLLDENGNTWLLFDGNDGKFVGLNLPTGQNAGSTIHSWIFALHMAQIWGLPFKIFVSVMGVLIAMLSVTGVYIWLKKRNARRISQEKRARLEEEVVA